MIREKLYKAGTRGHEVLLHEQILLMLGAGLGDVFDVEIGKEKELIYTMGGSMPFPVATYTMTAGSVKGSVHLGVPPKWLRYHGLKELDFVGVEVKGHRLILSKVEE